MSDSYSLSPRCGALTRSGKPCRSPAMANGRCRMHGGKSTGAPKGNRNAFKHGRYSAEAIQRRRDVSDLLRVMRALAEDREPEADPLDRSIPHDGTCSQKDSQPANSTAGLAYLEALRDGDRDHSMKAMRMVCEDRPVQYVKLAAKIVVRDS